MPGGLDHNHLTAEPLTVTNGEGVMAEKCANPNCGGYWTKSSNWIETVQVPFTQDQKDRTVRGFLGFITIVALICFLFSYATFADPKIPNVSMTLLCTGLAVTALG